MQCGREVTRVVVEDGRAMGVVTADGERFEAGRAVVADVGAVPLFERLLDPADVPARIVRGMSAFHLDPGTVKVDWALDGPVPWASPPAVAPGTVHVADSVEQMTEALGQVAARAIPAAPFLLAGQMTTTDPTRSPAGTESMWAYTHVPQPGAAVRDAGDGGIRGSWDRDDCERFADRMQQRIEDLAPGFGSRVMTRRVLGPRELEQRNANLVGGAINGGTSQLHQELFFRPVPGMLGRPETGIRGLYLGSASAHPGGGVHGSAGANAARRCSTARPDATHHRPGSRGPAHMTLVSLWQDRHAWSGTMPRRRLTAPPRSPSSAAASPASPLAVLLARAGKAVTLLEARRIGDGTTGGSTAKVSLLQGTQLSRIARRHPTETVRSYVVANAEGQAWLARFCDDHGVATQCRPAYTYATTGSGRRRRAAGGGRRSGGGARGGVAGRAAAPVRDTGRGPVGRPAAGRPHGAARGAGGAGPGARRPRGRGRAGHRGHAVAGPVRVTTERGTIEADTVVLATNMPILDRGGFFARMTPARSYGLAFTTPAVAVDGMYLSADRPCPLLARRARRRPEHAARRRPGPHHRTRRPDVGTGSTRSGSGRSSASRGPTRPTPGRPRTTCRRMHCRSRGRCCPAATRS